MLLDRPGSCDVMLCELRERKAALLDAAEELTAAIRELDRLECSSKGFAKKPFAARVDVALHRFLRKISCEELDTNIAGLKEMQLDLELSRVELISPYNQETRTAAVLARVCTQNAFKITNSIVLKSASTESKLPVKRAKVV